MTPPYLPAAFLTPITIRLQDDSAQRVGILPFLAAPEVVVWRNRVFVPWEHDLNFDYGETSFALADCTTEDAIMVRLEIPNGGFVASTTIPNCEQLPGVIRWGDRIFRYKGRRTYIEAFFAIAFNLETHQPELFAQI